MVILQEFMMHLLDLLLEIVRVVLFRNGLTVLEGFINTCSDVVTSITHALGMCETKSFNRCRS